MKWIETNNNEEVYQRTNELWDQLSADMKNEKFWADEIKTYRDEPAKRLKFAMENLPLPAAFREAMISLRAIIREKRKANKPYQKELAFLYWFAAIESFSIPYSEKLQQPGYNVFESVPGNVIKTLALSYNELGYENLGMLNKTDIKWIIENWGEPEKHSTMHEIHKNIWNKYESELPAKQKRELDEKLKNLNL